MAAAAEFPPAPEPISIVDDRISGMRLNNPGSLEAGAFMKAVKNAVEVSAAKGHTTLGGLSHEIYLENYKRRIHNDSVFRLCCTLYADCLQQEIPLHLLSADNGRAMYEAEKKGSLLEYYNLYGSGKDRKPTAAS